MKSWIHTHSFAATNENTTEIHEHIGFEHFDGLRGIRSRMLFPRFALLALHTMRKLITRREVCRRMAQLSNPS
ncbi:MAG: hypothetical protein GY758_20725 [Fuerstiella sp.]|nr:hypothetical protein [Fuerstiella sp.]MCP4505028.1 hypothetical protein [Fuerstiella sp.]